MQVSGFLVFLFALPITVLKCERTTFSALSCAFTRNQISPRFQNDESSISQIADPLAVRSADGYVSFYLYTSEHPEGQLIEPNNEESIAASSFDRNRPTKIITHGYASSKDSSACMLPKNAFLQSGDYNVIVIDWYPMQTLWGFILLDYWTVCGYIKEIGLYVASMIDFLEDQGMDLETTTLIGHSLGAHIMGIAGYNTRNTINYIIGLDPAMPSFEDRGHDERLTVHDAKVVEVIHTNDGDCGMPHQIGHYDFFPNGGATQPGCSKNSCSHSRAYQLYAESIISHSGFYGRMCRDYDAVREGNCFGETILMGGRVNPNVMSIARSGMYYVETRESPPYALGRRYVPRFLSSF